MLVINYFKVILLLALVGVDTGCASLPVTCYYYMASMARPGFPENGIW